MYVRGCVDGAGRQLSEPQPASKCRAVRQSTVVPPVPARTMFVATISMRTVAVRVSRKWTVAASRNPSLFGLTVVSSRPSPAKGTDPFVTGDDWSKERNDTTTTWGGTRVRFRLIGGAFKVVVRGRGINLSVVGKGNVTLAGAGTADDGSYSVNGGDYIPIPFQFQFPLSATSP